MSVLVAQADARHLPLADESVHLVVGSPPYNAHVLYDGYDDALPWDDYWEGLIRPTLAECFRVLVPGGRIALNIANVVRQDSQDTGHIVSTRNGGQKWKANGAKGRPWGVIVVPLLWQALADAGFLPREHLTWIKANAADETIVCNSSRAWGSWRSASNPVLRAVAEPVLIASKGSYQREPGESDLTRDEFMAWTRNVWFITTGHKDQYLGHPAMFPLELPRRLIKLYSYVGDVVLDPFGGSGTTARAARDSGRHGISIDTSARYCRLAAGRTSQMPLLEMA